MADQVPCAQCGNPVEHARECYATPTCFACIPPPAPLPVRAPKKPKGGCPECGAIGPADLYDDGSIACFNCGYIYVH